MNSTSRAVPSSRVADGHVEITTSVEPDGRVRVDVVVDGECVAAPTFSAAMWRAAQEPVLTEIGGVVERAIVARPDFTLSSFAAEMDRAGAEHAEAALDIVAADETRATDLSLARAYVECARVFDDRQAQLDARQTVR